MRTKNLEAALYRANPGYELVLFDRLPPHEQVLLEDLKGDPEFYGVLRPKQHYSNSLKSVCRESALLFLSMQTPGKLPGYVKRLYGGDFDECIAKLVLDGVLEIECGEGFRSGSDAYPWIFEEPPSPGAEGRIAQLSIGALRYAQALEIPDTAKLSARMYFYNRRPASPRLKSQFPDSTHIASCVGIHASGPNRGLLDRAWSRDETSPAYDGWLLYRSRRRQRTLSTDGVGRYKLYVSPVFESISEAFGAALGVFTEMNVSTFKVGSDIYGLLRPDKLIGYLRTFDEVQEAADHLRERLEGCPAHGVPFTATIDTAGLFSWGVDPPREAGSLSWQERESWRLWLTNRLAAAMMTAKAAENSTIEPWRFAMERVRLEGVDTNSWTPTRALTVPKQ